MTSRSLFIIILRVLGIISLKEVVYSIPDLAGVLFSFFTISGFGDAYVMLLISILAVAFNVAISYILIFRASYLIRLLKLDKGIHEPSLQLNISLPSILNIALIITAFLILLAEIPNLVRLIYLGLQQQEISMLRGDYDWSPAVFSGVKVVIGFLLVGERRRILEFLTRSSDEGKDYPTSSWPGKSQEVK